MRSTAKATLKPDAKAVIDQVVVLLKNDPALKLSIEGHTDNIGSDAANQKLSQERAQAVVAAVAQAGIGAERLSANGYGASKPVADTTAPRAVPRTGVWSWSNDEVTARPLANAVHSRRPQRSAAGTRALQTLQG